MQSDVLLRNVHIWKIIFGFSASLVSVNDVPKLILYSDFKVHQHSNRGDCLVCLCTVWAQNDRTGQRYIHEALLSMEVAWNVRSTAGFIHQLSVTHSKVCCIPLHSSQRYLTMLRRDAVHTGKQLSTFRSVGKDFPAGTGATSHNLQSSLRPLRAP